MKRITHSEIETYDLAHDFAKKLKGGEVLLLIGDLGAGKTVFAKGLAAGLGISNIITSPTFVLMKIYETKNQENKKSRKQKNNKIQHPHQINLAHIDAYRLKSGAELAAIGAADYFGDPGFVTAIEWAERIQDIWPEKNIQINFKIGKGNERKIEISL